MDDASIIALAESTIGYVDERWGRPVAWALSLAVTVLPIAILVIFLLR